MSTEFEVTSNPMQHNVNSLAIGNAHISSSADEGAVGLIRDANRRSNIENLRRDTKKFGGSTQLEKTLEPRASLKITNNYTHESEEFD